MNTKALSILTGQQYIELRDVLNRGYSGGDSFNAGCWLNTQDVNSITKGTVIDIGRDPKNSTWSVTVEVTSQRWVRYCCLSTVKVELGAPVQVGTFIGYGYKKLMRFEYCNPDKGPFPVRVSTRELYKHDPTPILLGQLDLAEVT